MLGFEQELKSGDIYQNELRKLKIRLWWSQYSVPLLLWKQVLLLRASVCRVKGSYLGWNGILQVVEWAELSQDGGWDQRSCHSSAEVDRKVSSEPPSEKKKRFSDKWQGFENFRISQMSSDLLSNLLPKIYQSSIMNTCLILCWCPFAAQTVYCSPLVPWRCTDGLVCRAH